MATGKLTSYPRSNECFDVADKKMEERKLLTECKTILTEIIAASAPFTSCNVVDETSGTIPLMERLEDAIRAANAFVITKE